MMIDMIIKCIRCEGEMEEGFVLDRGHLNMGEVNTWVEGKVDRNIWTGVQFRDKNQYEVKTFRCLNCGYLENYANEALS